MDDRIQALATVPILAGLSDDELTAIAGIVEEVEFPEGYPLMIKGIPAQEMAILAEGAAVVRRGDTVVAELGPGDVVGEIGLLAGSRRTASVLTTAPSRLWVIGAEDFDRLLASHPSMAKQVLAIVAARLAELEPDA